MQNIDFWKRKFYKESNRGTSLVVLWLRLGAPNAEAWVPTLVGELRTHTAWPKKKINQIEFLEITELTLKFNLMDAQNCSLYPVEGRM